MAWHSIGVINLLSIFTASSYVPIVVIVRMTDAFRMV